MGVATAFGLAVGLAGTQLASLGGPPSSWPTPDKTCRIDIDQQTSASMLDAIVSACKDDIRLAPNDVVAYIQRGIALYHGEDFAAAYSDFTTARKIAPQRADVLVYLGLTANRLGHADQAIAYYGAALDVDPDQTSALTNRAALYIAGGRAADAIRDLDRAIALHPDDSSLRFRRGYARLRNSDYAGAEADYSTGLQNHPDVEAYRYRGVARRNLGHYADAISDYDAALKLDPSDSNILVSRGIAWHFTGNDARAIADYTQALSRDGKDIDALMLRAGAFAATRRWDLAIADYSKALKLDPKNVDALTERASANYALGRYNDAIADVNRAMELGFTSNKGRANALYTRGMASMRLSKGSTGQADIEAAKALSAGLQQAANGSGEHRP